MMQLTNTKARNVGFSLENADDAALDINAYDDDIDSVRG